MAFYTKAFAFSTSDQCKSIKKKKKGVLLIAGGQRASSLEAAASEALRRWQIAFGRQPLHTKALPEEWEKKNL